MLARRIWLLLPLLFACWTPPTPPRLPPDAPQVFVADGRVLQVDPAPPAQDAEAVVYLTVQSADASRLHVVLGPAWYLDQEGGRFSPNDQVHVEGWLSACGGESVVVAKLIRSGAVGIELRDSELRPVWQQ